MVPVFPDSAHIFDAEIRCDASLFGADEPQMDESISIIAGRSAPYTNLGDWVALSDIDSAAKVLYWHLLMHPTQRNGMVTPSREELAALGGYNRPQSVDGRTVALVGLGAVEVHKIRYDNGLRCRNGYVVHQTPPDGYDGPLTIAEFRARLSERPPGAQPRPTAYQAHTRAVWDRDGWRCVWCGDHRSLTVDHIIAVANGGTDDFGNLQTLCKPCNSSKGTKAHPAASRRRLVTA